MHNSITLTRSIGVDENVTFNLEFSGLLDPTPSEDSSLKMLQARVDGGFVMKP